MTAFDAVKLLRRPSAARARVLDRVSAALAGSLDVDVVAADARNLGGQDVGVGGLVAGRREAASPPGPGRKPVQALLDGQQIANADPIAQTPRPRSWGMAEASPPCAISLPIPARAARAQSGVPLCYDSYDIHHRNGVHTSDASQEAACWSRSSRTSSGSSSSSMSPQATCAASSASSSGTSATAR